MYSAPSDAKYSYIAKWYRSYSTSTSWTGPGTSQGGVAAREPSVTLTKSFPGACTVAVYDRRVLSDA